MLLSELLTQVDVLNEYSDCEITAVTGNTKELPTGAAFVCLKGTRYDGNDFAKLALQHGAAVVVTDRQLQGLNEQVIVEDARAAYALMCKAFYGNAADRLHMVATTGTNGKTSVTSIITMILNRAAMNCGSITTIKASYRDYTAPLANTTPDPATLHKLLNDMEAMGCRAVCLEASSHALCQQRLHGITFDVGVFTNLTQDHLDYHGNMEAYYQAKFKLFSMSRHAIINIDDSYGRRIVEEIAPKIPCHTYSTIDPNATLFAKDIVYNDKGVSYLLCHDGVESRLFFPVPGHHSVQNSLAAVAAARQLGVSLDTIVSALRDFGGVTGRSEIIETDTDFTVICDYAHTPDGLYNIITGTKQYAKGRVIVLFGCGGDRDRTKRPQMGRIAGDTADFTIVTSDNPRSENPTAIINDILKGIKPGAPHIALVNRAEAIRYAISIARAGDVILLAGKGHELYSQIGNARLYYDERKIVKKVLAQVQQQRECDGEIR